MASLPERFVARAAPAIQLAVRVAPRAATAHVSIVLPGHVTVRIELSPPPRPRTFLQVPVPQQGGILPHAEGPLRDLNYDPLTNEVMGNRGASVDVIKQVGLSVGYFT